EGPAGELVPRLPSYQNWVSNMVSQCNRLSLPLMSPAGATLTIGGVEDTIYRDKPGEVNGWGKFYLEDEVNMQVIGVVEGTYCPYDLVLMTCEDKKIYAYDGEELHLVAPGLKQLCDEGIEYPASKSYYNGEAFKNMVSSYFLTENKYCPVELLSVCIQHLYLLCSVQAEGIVLGMCYVLKSVTDAL
uniref:Uncharacterized protein n=1 Tax=Salarias fasciatus TaxID=181472 RepID=A0A672GN54_SALFA